MSLGKHPAVVMWGTWALRKYGPSNGEPQPQHHRNPLRSKPGPTNLTSFSRLIPPPQHTVDMRLLTGLAALSLVTIAAANNVAQLSPDETRLLLAERLGVSRFHDLQLYGEDIHKTTLDIASALENEQESVDTMFAETPRKGNFVLSLAGMKDNRCT